MFGYRKSAITLFRYLLLYLGGEKENPNMVTVTLCPGISEMGKKC